MITSPYPAATAVAPKIRAYFVRHLSSIAETARSAVAPVPEVEVIESLINTTFWASLRREEGYIPKISMAYLPPAHNPYSMLFEHPLPLSPAALTKVAPVVERAGIHLGVWRHDGELCVWGTTSSIPSLCLVLEVVEPGLIVVKHHRGERSGKYVNVAVLEGDQIKMVDDTSSSLPDCPSLISSLLGFDSPSSWVGSVNVLVQLAVSMRAHGRGGLLLIVPSGTDAWRDSIVSPISYAISPPYRGLTELLREGDHLKKPGVFQEELREIVDSIGGLTAVDGATVLTDTFELLAFGAKIARRRGSPQVELVTLTEPVEGGKPRTLTPTQLGGTRHLSAAQFVHDQRDAIVLAASQDRRFTVFAWSPCAEQVHGHQVEALLL